MSQSLKQKFLALPKHKQTEFIESLTEAEADALLKSWRYWLARPEQIAPDGDWFVWLVLAGRGFGKTRTANEYIVERIVAGEAKQIALVGRTVADVTKTLVRNKRSGILAVCERLGVEADYKPSNREITFPKYNAIATTYSADAPDQLRGPEHDTAIADELAAWPMADPENNAWSNLQMGCRIGDPRIVAMTTPRPTKTIKALVADPKNVVTRGSTYDNAANLSPAFLEQIKERYEGTRLGRQELLGEVLMDVDGALWRLDDIDRARVSEAPRLKRIVVAVDPAVSTNASSDYTAIVVAGIGWDGEFYVLHSEHIKASPNEWASRVLSLFDEYNADRIVAERNNGGDMVEHTIRTVRTNAPIKTIHASRGKQTRAEPVAALYEQCRVHHVGEHKELEDELIVFPVATDVHDDLVDALVYAITELTEKQGAQLVTFNSYH